MRQSDTPTLSVLLAPHAGGGRGASDAAVAEREDEDVRRADGHKAVDDVGHLEGSPWPTLVANNTLSTQPIGRKRD